MLLTGLPDSSDAFDSRLIAKLATECVAGVSRVNKESTTADDVSGVFEKASLRVIWMDLKELAHMGIL
jgi:hypothetical protein